MLKLKNALMLVVLGFIGFVSSCNDGKDDCIGDEDLNYPVVQQARAACGETGHCDIYLYKGRYKNITVYFRALIGASCDVWNNVDLLDCSGHVITTVEDVHQKMEDVVLIFKCR